MNISELSKEEIVRLSRTRCKHGHPLLQHLSCYKKQKEERIGIIDIETEALDCNFGILLTYYIKEFGKNKYYYDAITKQDIKRWGREAKEDTRIVRNLVRDIQRFDRLIGHYSSRFDLPFIRTRAVICGVDFPAFGELYQTDTWQYLRKKFKLSRNSLENGVRTLTGRTNKNHLTLASKHGCLRGDKWAVDYTLLHNKNDVVDTDRLYAKVRQFMKNTKSSI